MGTHKGNGGWQQCLPVTKTHEADDPPEKNPADLPYDIIQLIQSLLDDDRYVVRSTLLCKSWLGASSTSPNVVFHRDRPLSSSPRLAERMEQTLVSYLRQNILLEKLHIYAPYGSLSCEELDEQVHLWLKFAYESRPPRRISGEQPCSPLKVLKLYHVRIVDESDIYVVLSECPLLEEVILYGCRGIGRVVVTPDFDRLRLFEFKCLGGDALVEIITPALRSFSYGICDTRLPRNRNKPLELERARVINIDACRFLTDLSFEFLKIDDWCLDDMSRFMFLECLAFDHCDLPTRIVIAFPTLKKLKLQRCNKSLKEVDIKCDSLSELSLSWCHGNGNFRLSCSASPKMQLIVADDLSHRINISYESKVVPRCCQGNDKTICLTRELLKGRKDNQVIHMGRIYWQPFTNVEAIWLDGTLDQPPQSLEFLFDTYRPKYIFSSWKSLCDNNFTKALLSELMDRKKKCDCPAQWLWGINFHKVACWRHLLKDRRVELRLSSDGDDGMWKPFKPVYHWRSLVAGSQDLIGAYDIRFTLTWHKSIR